MHVIFSFLATLCLAGCGVCMIAFPAAMLHDHKSRNPGDAALYVLYALMAGLGGLIVFGPLAAVTAP